MTAARPVIPPPVSARESWLPDMDLNHDKQIQSLLCYRYTIGQTSGYKVEISRRESRFVNGFTGVTISALSTL